MRMVPTILAALALAGCFPVSIDTPPVPVTLTAQGRAAATNHMSLTKIRTFLNVGENRVWIEDLVGVPCRIESENYRVDIVTPAILALPTVGMETPPVTATCEYNGETVSRTNGCYFTGNNAPNVSNADPRGKCTHADFSLTFGN